ncbi:MAG TPA: CocE/NonD family hydrolase [Gemmatimonadaceae bacterium]
MNAPRLARVIAGVVLFAAPTAIVAQTPQNRAAQLFDMQDVMIPMRDGVKLHTKIFIPKNLTTDLPFIMARTPYGIRGTEAVFNVSYAELADEGYIFAFQDIRGRFESEGQFIMLRNPRDKRDPKAIDESTDTYDTIDWLLKNVPHNNGRVGMLGVSYPGWLTVMAMLDPHPALKAVSPQASPASMFLGDDFHHNGAFRLSYGFEYVAMMESGKEVNRFAFDQYDTYAWYLNLGSLANVNPKHFKGERPTWNNFVEHPNFDAFWQREALMQYLDRVTVPTLNVAGWWDQEDFYGPVKIYETLEKHDTKKLNYLVVGPWNHGGWRGVSGQKLGNIDFGSATAPYYRKNIEAPWFAYWLKDKGALNLAEATTFEAGANVWRSYDSWPPKATVSTPRKLYFQANGKLGYDAPKDVSKNAFDAYTADPNKPVPYRPRPIVASLGGAGSTWSTWLADDQRFVQDRPDVFAWESPVLTEDVVIAGDIAAHLFAATTGSDADFVAKLIDVYPEDDAKLPGYQFMVANDVFRGRFRKSFEKPEAITPNKTEEFTIDLHTQSYRFLKGHKIRVQVQSSWFPLIDRNPQTFVPNIFKAKDSDFRAATQRVYRTKDAASYISLPIVRSPVVP